MEDKLTRVKEKIHLPTYIESRILEQQQYADANFKLNSERNAYMLGIYKASLETALNYINKVDKLV